MSELIREVMSAEQAGGDLFDWQTVETALGTRLPSDYKEFMSVYGTGSVGAEGLTVLPPTAPEGYPYRDGGMADETWNLRETWNTWWRKDLAIPGPREQRSRLGQAEAVHRLASETRVRDGSAPYRWCSTIGAYLTAEFIEQRINPMTNSSMILVHRGVPLGRRTS